MAGAIGRWSQIDERFRCGRSAPAGERPIGGFQGRLACASLDMVRIRNISLRNISLGRSRMVARHEARPPLGHPRRRTFLMASGAVTALALIGSGTPSGGAYAAALSKAQRDRLTPDGILALMKAGNRRFYTGQREDRNF